MTPAIEFPADFLWGSATSAYQVEGGADAGDAARHALGVLERSVQGRAVLIVLDRHGRVVGTISDRDICIAVAHSTRNATHIAVHEVMLPDELGGELASAKHA